MVDGGWATVGKGNSSRGQESSGGGRGGVRGTGLYLC